MKEKQKMALLISFFLIIFLIICYVFYSRFFSVKYVMPREAFSGVIQEYHYDRDGNLEYLLVKDSEFRYTSEKWGEAIHQIYISDDTEINSQAGEVVRDDFINGKYGYLPIDGNGKVDSLRNRYYASTVSVGEILTDEHVYIENEIIDVWKTSNGKIYKSEEGCTLLATMDYIKPNWTERIEGEKVDLSEEVVAYIEEYYTQKGIIYQPQEVLQDSYHEYKKSDSSSDYEAPILIQTTKPVSQTETTITFKTEVSGLDSQSLSELMTFDKVTGAPMSS